jgi:hypothetical protein
LDLCYFDRKRFDKLRTDLPTEIVSYRKYKNDLYRAHFSTKELTKDKNVEEERSHLLWIQLVNLESGRHVKYCCDCKYFDYRQRRPAKRMFGITEIAEDNCIVLHPKSFNLQKQLFNIDKHAFLALKELFGVHVQIVVQ